MGKISKFSTAPGEPLPTKISSYTAYLDPYLILGTEKSRKLRPLVCFLRYAFFTCLNLIWGAGGALPTPAQVPRYSGNVERIYGIEKIAKIRPLA
mgnify:FL=1